MLETLDCYSNQIKELDITDNINLTHVYCNNNQIEMLDVSNNRILERIICYRNNMNPNPDISVVGWRERWEAPLNLYKFLFYPQYTQDGQWSISFDNFWNGDERTLATAAAYVKQDCVLLTAFYKDSKLIKITSEKYRYHLNDDYAVFAISSLDGFAYDEGWTIKAFAWNNERDMLPMINSLEVDWNSP